MFDWTVLNLQNERGRTGGGTERPVSVPRADDTREPAGHSGGGGAAAAGASATRAAAAEGGGAGTSGEGGK